MIVHLVAGARPNFMKIAPLYHALARTDWAEPLIVHTGQHFSPNMSERFFSELGLPKPHHHLGVAASSHGRQVGETLIAYEAVLMKARPDWVIVVGDVDSTLAGALAAAKLGIPTAHLEAGLRSFDRTMPEEINRLVTDSICELLWTPSPDADDNLRREGVAPERIERVGNIMIDSLELMRPRFEAANTPARFGLNPSHYAVMTLHRPSNVDRPEALGAIVDAVERAAKKMSVIFPTHPRTHQNLDRFGLTDRLRRAGVLLEEPLGYIDFMGLVLNAGVAITDSGGIQEETSYLGIPCLTLRKNTERPITVSHGTNRLIEPGELASEIDRILSSRRQRPQPPELWDGHTAGRVVASLKKHQRATVAT